MPETIMVSQADVVKQPSVESPDLTADGTATEDKQAELEKKKTTQSLEDDFVLETVFLSPKRTDKEDQEDDNE